MFGINLGKRKEPLAALDAADDLLASGRTKAAIRAYQKLVDSKHPDVAAKAGYKLGILRRNQGEISQAVDLLRDVADSGHPEMGAVAAFSLAGLLSNVGLLDSAAKTYQQVADSDHHLASTALLCLAELRVEQGRRDDAIALLHRAVEADDDDNSPKALVDLGDLRREDGDIDGAAELYQRAASSGHPQAAPIARDLLHELGRKSLATGPTSRQLKGVSDEQSVLLMKEDSTVHGLWFADETEGSRIATDSRKLIKVLYANHLADYVDKGHYGRPDSERGGYLISFHD